MASPSGTTRDDEFVRLRLADKLVEAKSRARAVHDVLGPSRSRLQWLMLHKCSQYLIDHYLAHCKPHDTLQMATEWDTFLEELLGEILGVPVASVPFGLERLRLPLSLGGFGIPSRVRLRLAAFLGTVVKAIPTLVDKVDPNSGKVFQRGYFSSPHMESLLGIGSFDGDSWDLGPFLASGVPLADAMADSWQQLQALAAPRGAAAPSDGILARNPSNLGQGVQNLQHTLTKALDAAAQRHLLEEMDRSHHKRAVGLYRNSDEFSRAFLTALPSCDMTCTDAEFREMFAHLFGAPAPSCAPVVHQPLHCGVARGNGCVDQHGDNILNSTMEGGMPTKLRHNPLVEAIAFAALEAGGVVRTEDRRLFASALPPTASHQSAIVPDIVIVLPGQPTKVHELKTISLNRTWYGNDLDGPGAPRRARAVWPAYLRHARALDRKVGLATAANPANPSGPNLAPGPVEQRLRAVAPISALVVGAWGEVSEDLRLLVGNLASVGAARMAAQLGLPRDQATPWARQLLVQRIGFVATRGIAQHRLHGLMAVAPAPARRAASARAGGDGARVFSLKGAIAAQAAARHCGAWSMALTRA